MVTDLALQASHYLSLAVNWPQRRGMEILRITPDDEDHVFVLLTNQAGSVLWQARGANTEEKIASLRQAIAELHLQAQSA